MKLNWFRDAFCTLFLMVALWNHLRPGRDAVGGASHVHPGGLLPGAGAGIVKAKPELANVEPFKTVLSGNREAMAKLSMDDLFKILAATLTGMSVDEFAAEAKKGSGGMP